MSTPQFQISRQDGRSNQQVVIDVVATAEPGTIFDYDTIGSELAKGTARDFPKRSVQGIVRLAQKRLLSEFDRTLVTLAGVGYKMAFAKDHMGLSLGRRHKADRQIAHGLHLLRHVRWNELDDNTRQAHTGQLMVMEAVCQNQKALERRQAKVEDVLASLKSRLDQIDSTGKKKTN